MPGYHIHYACADAVLEDGNVYAGPKVRPEQTISGAVMLVSTTPHRLHDYEVFISYSHAAMLPWDRRHQWTYLGTVDQVFLGVVCSAPTVAMCARCWGTRAFRNYAGGCSFYLRATHSVPSNPYHTNELDGVGNPYYAYLASRVRFIGVFPMRGW